MATAQAIRTVAGEALRYQARRKTTVGCRWLDLRRFGLLNKVSKAAEIRYWGGGGGEEREELAGAAQRSMGKRRGLKIPTYQ